MITEELNIDLEPIHLFAPLARRRDAVFLDCSKKTPHSRYSVIGLSPSLTFKAWGELVCIRTGTKSTSVRAKPMHALQALLRKKEATCDRDFPVGAAIGYIGYETGYTLETIRTRHKPGLRIPDCCLNFYDSLLIYDHEEKRWLVTSVLDEIPNDIKGATTLIAGHMEAQRPPSSPEPVRSTTSRSDFLKGVERIKDHIRKGDVYQVNLSQRFSAPLPAGPFSLYARLRKLSPVPYGAYLSLDGFQVLSLSPERFVKISGNKAQTKPVKGTIARGTDPDDDAWRKATLRGSTKDRAELLMITDLERNDLGRVCSPHTVSVPSLLSVEEYSSVFHLVSTVEGVLAPGRDHVDCLSAMFPGGSITGAPKISAMNIIEELEPVRRNVYTGAIGYIGYNRRTDLNVAIRTATLTGGSVCFHGGGGIVIDSDPEAEYDETLHKVKPFLDAISPGSYERMLGRKEFSLS